MPDNAAYMSVRLPTLPRYISKISISCEGTCSCGVIPNVRPTVPNADAVSYNGKIHISNDYIKNLISKDYIQENIDTEVVQDIINRSLITQEDIDELFI